MQLKVTVKSCDIWTFQGMTGYLNKNAGKAHQWINTILLLNVYGSYISHHIFLIFPLDAATNSAWSKRAAVTEKKNHGNEGVPLAHIGVMCLRGSALPESGGIFYTFFKVHCHFCVFFFFLFVLSCFNLLMSSPAAECRLNRGDGDRCLPLTRSSLSPLSLSLSLRGYVILNTSSVGSARDTQITTALPPPVRGVAARAGRKREGRGPCRHKLPQQKCDHSNKHLIRFLCRPRILSNTKEHRLFFFFTFYWVRKTYIPLLLLTQLYST